MTPEALWQEFLQILCVEVGSRVVETWFKAVVFTRWDSPGKIVYLKAPNAFVKDWVSSHYIALIKQHLGRLLNESNISIIFLDISEQGSAKEESSPAVTREVEKPIVATRSEPQLPVSFMQYHFDTFVVGPHNSLAYAAACAVAQTPGALYNPLLIYGGSGVGKTHLLHAIAHQLKGIHKQAKIMYQSADRFVGEFMAALRADKVRQLEAKYRDVDVLLMDDIQLMSNKETTQEFFFQIFTNLQQSRKQIVFTSDVLPSRMNGLMDRMRTRLEGGLVTDIQPATLDSRVAIIKKKADNHQVELNDEIAYFMAARIDSNVRDLEGNLIRVLAFASLTRQTVSLDLVKRVLSSSLEQERKIFELQHIALVVAKHFNYTLADLRSPRRTKDLAQVRHIALYFMKKLTDKSLRDIASFLDRKDHSTVLHAVEKIGEQKIQDGRFAGLLDRLEQNIIT